MRFESFFDRAQYGTGLRGPYVLYHYTSWEAAENIIRSQRFWATAHDGTNDKEELVYADTTILDVARRLEATANGTARRILRLFLKTYEYTRIGAARRAYLVCFSQKRDDPNQWCEYGAMGLACVWVSDCSGFQIQPFRIWLQASCRRCAKGRRPPSLSLATR